MKRCGRPAAIVTDGCRSYRAAARVIGNQARREACRQLNSRVGYSRQPFRRREWAMAKFRSAKALQKFAAIHSSFHNRFNLEGHLYSRQNVKEIRAAASAQWRQLPA